MKPPDDDDRPRQGSDEDKAPRLEGWTWRRVPGRLALALAAGAVLAVVLFAAHVTGWGMLARAERGLAVAALGAGLLFGLPIAFVIGAPLLRAAAGDALSRALFVRAGAGLYGGLAFLWMALIPVGPPLDVVMAAGIEPDAPPGWWPAAVLAYRHLLTPLAFAFYGALAAWGGWWLAFGAARRIAVVSHP